MQQNRN